MNSIIEKPLFPPEDESSSKSERSPSESGYRYESGAQTYEVPETKQAIAVDAAKILQEYAEHLPEQMLCQVAYLLAAKVMERNAAQITSTFDEWAEEHSELAVMANLILQNALAIRGKIAIPRQIDPAKYIKKIKASEGLLDRLLSSKGKSEELKTELHAMVVEAIEQVEALQRKAAEMETEISSTRQAAEQEARERIAEGKNEKDRIIAEANEEASRRLASAKQEEQEARLRAQNLNRETEAKRSQLLTEAKQEADSVIAAAEAKERATTAKLETLEQRIVQLRAEATDDPGLVKTLAKLEADDDAKSKEKLIQEANAFVAFIPTLSEKGIFGSERASSDNIKNNRKLLTYALQALLRSLDALSEIEAHYGAQERQVVVDDMPPILKLGKSLLLFEYSVRVYRDGYRYRDRYHSFFSMEELELITELFKENPINFKTIVRNASILVPKFIAWLNKSPESNKVITSTDDSNQANQEYLEEFKQFENLPYLLRKDLGSKE